MQLQNSIICNGLKTVIIYTTSGWKSDFTGQPVFHERIF